MTTNLRTNYVPTAEIPVATVATEQPVAAAPLRKQKSDDAEAGPQSWTDELDKEAQRLGRTDSLTLKASPLDRVPSRQHGASPGA